MNYLPYIGCEIFCELPETGNKSAHFVVQSSFDVRHQLNNLLRKGMAISLVKMSANCADESMALISILTVCTFEENP